ncbi:MAG: prenyltransferase [Sphaerochaetaceae bacterium]|nr:prenyltransferase [Sphaerochaetaceae bacterium]
MKQIKSFIKNYWIALRVFSLTLAFASTAFGILAAYINGYFQGESTAYMVFLVTIILIAGLASQAGANLINDFFEGSFKYTPQGTKTMRFLKMERSYFDVFVFMSGIGVLLLCCAIGLYLIYRTDMWMLVIGLIGVIGSYAYTGEPFVYKRRGLGVPLSFILMGPLMSLGSYYAIAGSFSFTPILLNLPTSFLIPALMISNEMRDFLRDQKFAMGTMTVRIGDELSKFIFTSLMCGVYILTIIYIIVGLFPVYSIVSFVTLPYAIRAINNVRNYKNLGIQNTTKVHLYYSLIIMICLIISFI